MRAGMWLVALAVIGCTPGGMGQMDGGRPDGMTPRPDGMPGATTQVTFVVRGWGTVAWHENLPAFMSGEVPCDLTECTDGPKTLASAVLAVSWRPSGPYEFVSAEQDGVPLTTGNVSLVGKTTSQIVVTFATHPPASPCAVPSTFGAPSCTDTMAASRNGGASLFGYCSLSDLLAAHRVRFEGHGPPSEGEYDLATLGSYDAAAIGVLIFPDQATPIIGPSAGSSAYWCNEGTVRILDLTNVFDVELENLNCKLVDIDANFVTTDDPSGCTTQIWNAHLTAASITPM